MAYPNTKPPTNPFMTGSDISSSLNRNTNQRNTNPNGYGPYSMKQDKPASNNQGYRETQAPHGMDQTNPGAAEQHWQNNQNMWMNSPTVDWVQQQLPGLEQPGFGESYAQQNLPAFGSPGQGQQYWNQVQGLFNTMTGGYSGPNNAQDSYNRVSQNIPGSFAPQFDDFYDRATDKAVADMNSQAAARGTYGSSATLNNIGNVVSDMNAQRANRASDFLLSDSQNQQGWHGLAGQLGRSADISGMDTFGSGLEGVRTFGDLAFNAENADYMRDRAGFDIASGVDNSELARLGLGIDSAMGIDDARFNRLAGSFNAANMAQDQRDGRIQDAFSNKMDMLAMVLPFISGQYGDIIDSDQDYFSQDINTGLGATQNQVADSRYNLERMMRDFESLMGLITAQQQNKRSGG